MLPSAQLPEAFVMRARQYFFGGVLEVRGKRNEESEG